MKHLKYVIDGFIVSDNVAVHSVKTKDEQFKYTDHQPVKMEVVKRKVQTVLVA